MASESLGPNLKMASISVSVVEKVLSIPELVEKQISYLDINSIASLAEVQPMIIKILERGTIWNNLKRRSCQGWKVVNCQEEDLERVFEEKRREIGNLGKMMKKMKDPHLFLRGLLHDIIHEGTNQGITMVELNCRRCPNSPTTESTTHKAWEWHFLLLEEVEGAFGSVSQEIETIKMNPLQGKRLGMRRSWLLAVSSRARLQQSMISVVDIIKFSCSDLVEAQVLLDLAENCRELKMRELKIDGDVGRKGWTALAKALDLHPTCCLWAVVSSSGAMLQARREDLRSIWEHLYNDSRAQWTLTGFPKGPAPFSKRGTDEDREIEWNELVTLLETKKNK